jgi:flagellar biosynthesis/type III secretory pathway protein FliH
MKWWKEERKEGWNDGRKEGRKKGRKEGRIKAVQSWIEHLIWQVGTPYTIIVARI